MGLLAQSRGRSDEAETQFRQVLFLQPRHADALVQMMLLSELGQGNRDAITASTSLAADTLRLEGLGRIAEGATADLVVVSSDPIASLSALWEPPIVVQAGEPIQSI